MSSPLEKENFFRVRLYSEERKEVPLDPPGWIVIAEDAETACKKVAEVVSIDNGPDGEFSSYPDLAAEPLEWKSDHVAEIIG